MPSSSLAETELDRLLPTYDFRERHARVVAAAPELVYRALHDVTLGEMPLVRPLFALRSLPARFVRRGGLPRTSDAPILAQMIDFGFAILAEQPPRELVAGEISKPWTLKGARPLPSIRDAAGFAAFDRAGFVKVAMNFGVVEHDDGTLLTTETRILATDPRSRRNFGRYWFVIRLGSGAIRRSWLRAIARRAERDAAAVAAVLR